MAGEVRSSGAKQKTQSVRQKLAGGVDTPFLVLVLILLCFGLIMLFSASYAYSYYYEGNSYHYILRQAAFAALGLIGMFFVANFITPYFVRRFKYIMIGVTVVMLLVVFLFSATNDAHRWIRIGSFTFQPSEVAKFSLIICFAHWLDVQAGKQLGFVKKITPYVALMALYCGLIVIEPHLSATLLIAMIGGLMLMIGDNDKRIYIALLVLLALGVLALLLIPSLRERAMSRIGPWLDSYVNINVDEMVYQTKQSLYAIASGGLFGVGLGNSRQKQLYLLEPQNDFIFAIVCEELGLVGGTILIILFALLVLRGLQIAMHTKDRYSCMVVTGICIQVAVQVLFNIAVVTNAAPNTGISLPFFSYGGSSLMILLCEMGLVLSASKYSKLQK